jgi:hypothetical protein
MSDWVSFAVQAGSALFTIGGVVIAVASRFARIEGRIENLAIEIRKDRELVEHRIHQLEIGLSQVRSELIRLSYSVGHRLGQDSKQEDHP